MDWLYPELKRIDPKDRSSALREAKDSSFDAIENAIKVLISPANGCYAAQRATTAAGRKQTFLTGSNRPVAAIECPCKQPFLSRRSGQRIESR